MKRSAACRVVLVLASVSMALPAIARGQSVPPPPSPSRADAVGPPAPSAPTSGQGRYQMSLMEAALERAVGGACAATTESLPVNVPAPWFWGGTARVRGFRLQGYGLFFDVEVPLLPATITWSLETLGPAPVALENDLASLRELVGSVPDPQLKRQIEQQIKRLEVQLVAVNGSSAKAQRLGEGGTNIQVGRLDPTETYVTELKNWLSNAMLDHPGVLPLGGDEWLTVAARSGEGRVNVMPAPVSDTSILLRMRAADLQAFRSGKITREEARKRIEMPGEW